MITRLCLKVKNGTITSISPSSNSSNDISCKKFVKWFYHVQISQWLQANRIVPIFISDTRFSLNRLSPLSPVIGFSFLSLVTKNCFRSLIIEFLLWSFFLILFWSLSVLNLILKYFKRKSCSQISVLFYVGYYILIKALKNWKLSYTKNFGIKIQLTKKIFTANN